MKLSLPGLAFILIAMVDSCSSGKTALKKGDYYDAVLEAIHRLRESPTHGRAITVLQESYQPYIDFVDSNIKNGLASDDPRKWRNAVKGYEQVNFINDQIKTSLGAQKVIPNPATRFKELADAKVSAAEEAYQEGIQDMMKNDREDSKKAYFDFKDANSFQPGYKESIEMMNQAEFNATLRIAYEEINNSQTNFSLIPVINGLKRQFLAFKPITQQDTVPPQQYLRLIFNGYRLDYNSGVSTRSETATQRIKTGETRTPDGKVTEVYETATAYITIYHKTRRGVSTANFNISDVNNAALLNSSVEGIGMWQYDWATYRGDSRALQGSSASSLINRGEAFPNDQDIFNQAMRNLEANLSQQLKNYYSQY